MDIYDVATRLGEAEARMRKNITEFEAGAARGWAESKEKLDMEYSAEIEDFRRKMISETDAKVNALKESLSKSISSYKSSKAREYAEKARKAIKEVVPL